MFLIRKISSLSIQKMELFFISWLLERRYRLLSVLLIYMIGHIVGRLPYFNLFLTSEIVVTITIVLSLLIFRVSAKGIIKVGILLIIIAALLQLVNKREIVESIGNVSYVLFFAGVIKSILSLTP